MKKIEIKNIHDTLKNDIYDDLMLNIGYGLKGRVEITDVHNNRILEKSNLVLYKGREWLAQRAANFLSPVEQDHNRTNHYINYFTVGIGGATPGDILTPLSPEKTDEDLNTPVLLNTNDSTYITKTRDNDALTYQLKTITSKTFKNDLLNQNRYLIVQFQTMLLNSDANGPNGNSFFDINEAGLYIGDESGTPGSVSIFARCTFSTIRKDNSRGLVFNWYIYF